MPPEAVVRALDGAIMSTPKGKGVGLGLSGARRVVQAHGGSIAIDSRPGSTAVRVRLPVHQASA